jgi:hypothetical protein
MTVMHPGATAVKFQGQMFSVAIMVIVDPVSGTTDVLATTIHNHQHHVYTTGDMP